MVLSLHQSPGSLALLRLNEDGSIDDSFGGSGYVITEDFNSNLNAKIELQDDGKILIAGYTWKLGVLRFEADGTLDTQFGNNGLATIGNVSVAGSNIFYTRIQKDGKILVGTNDYLDFFMARLLNDGAVPVAAMTANSFLHVYPNPASDQLIINYPFSLNELAKITIADATGKIYYEQNVNSNSAQYPINLKALSSGIYMLTLQTVRNCITMKFVKQ
jgi:uncharacterized delta-60 repeat protein